MMRKETWLLAMFLFYLVLIDFGFLVTEFITHSICEYMFGKKVSVANEMMKL